MKNQRRTAIRTLTWLIAARELDCNYVWQFSVNAARAAGVSDALIAGLENDRPPSKLNMRLSGFFTSR